MVMKCCVPTCGLLKDDPGSSFISFHKLPARQDMREAWMKELKQHFSSITQKYIYVCSQHFETNCFQYSGLCKRKMLKSGSIPTIFTSFEISKFQCSQELSSSHSLEIHNNCDGFMQCESLLFANERITPPSKEKSNPAEFTELEKKQRSKIEKLQRTNKSLLEKLGRCRRKMYRFKYLFETLQRKKYISENQSTDLENSIPEDNHGILERILNSKRSKVPLPTCLRKFACTLAFYSPKAYDYVRKTLIKCLPHRKTISTWYRMIPIDCGINKPAIAAVKNKVSKSTGPVFCNLVFDEISLKKKVETVNGIEYGFVDLGKGDAAENAIVCMLVCINGNWKIPLSYHFIKNLNAVDKKHIVDETLEALYETDVKLISITFDGPKCNLLMSNLLGASLDIDGQIRNYFPHPITKEPIFVIIDACHSLKLVRNCIASNKRVIYDCEGNIISWNYLQSLVILQARHAELYLAHKMTTEHINWEDNTMNVRIAAQTFSESVSAALHYLEYETDLCEFKGAAGTAKFCKIMNDAFDILNSRVLYSKDARKTGITSENIEVIENKVELFTDYIKGLKYLDGQRLVDSPRKTGFIGMILGLHSVIAIFKQYIQKEIVNGYLLTYKLSQDHLEIFFSAVRSKGGYNNNPTCRQFITIFKQLLFHADIKGSENGNCVLLDDTVLLEISKDETRSYREQGPKLQIEVLNPKKIVTMPQHKLYVHDAICYTAGFICRKILRTSKCFICPIVLTHQPGIIDETNDNSEYRSKLIDIKNRGRLIYPSTDVINICKITENIFKTFYVSRKGIFKQLIKLTIKKIPHSCLQLTHSLSDNIGQVRHRIELIMQIASIYLQMRINEYEKEMKKPKKKLRRRYTKYILFNHE